MRENNAPLLGVCQTPVLDSRQELEAFLDKAAAQAAAHDPARPALFLFPELFWGGFVYDACEELAATTPGLLTWLQREAATRNLLCGGSFWEAAPDGLRNSFFFFGSSLEKPERIRGKRHLFPLSEEERHFTADTGPLALSSCLGLACGVAICFELRFPEIFRYQSGLGMDLALLSSQWPATRASHLETLSRARAIENQCFLLSCNACGPSLLGELAGSSRCMTPWGQDMFVCGSGPEVRSAPFAPELLQRARAAFDSRPQGPNPLQPAPADEIPQGPRATLLDQPGTNR